MLHLNGILTGDGEICVAGLSLEKDQLPLVRAKVGMVFQNPDDQLFSPTVFEDVAFGPLHMGLPEDEVRNRVGDALEKVGMSKYARTALAPSQRRREKTNFHCHRAFNEARNSGIG